MIIIGLSLHIIVTITNFIVFHFFSVLLLFFNHFSVDFFSKSPLHPFGELIVDSVHFIWNNKTNLVIFSSRKKDCTKVLRRINRNTIIID